MWAHNIYSVFLPIHLNFKSKCLQMPSTKNVAIRLTTPPTILKPKEPDPISKPGTNTAYTIHSSEANNLIYVGRLKILLFILYIFT